MIVVVSNRDKPCGATVRDLQSKLRSLKAKAAFLGNWPFTAKDVKTIRSARILIVIGGDGTVLGTAAALEDFSVRILPVNFGTLGFMSSVSSEDALDLIEDLVAKSLPDAKSRWRLDERPMIDVTVNDRKLRAVNEVVLRSGGSGKLIAIDARVSGRKLTSFRADGAIVATATGSTAYNLAAGGPILHPAIEALVFNPICPHSLTHKPLVLPGRDEISLTAKSPSKEKPMLMIDGQMVMRLDPDDVVRTRLSEHRLRFVKHVRESYYAILTRKMKWGA